MQLGTVRFLGTFLARPAEVPEVVARRRRLRAAVLVLLDPPPGGLEELWSAIAAHVSRGELELAADTVHQLASQPDANDGQDAALRSGASCCAAIRA